jgi:hypothetical protein
MTLGSWSMIITIYLHSCTLAGISFGNYRNRVIIKLLACVQFFSRMEDKVWETRIHTRVPLQVNLIS